MSGLCAAQVPHWRIPASFARVGSLLVMTLHPKQNTMGILRHANNLLMMILLILELGLSRAL